MVKICLEYLAERNFGLLKIFWNYKIIPEGELRMGEDEK